jgi:hypothetical protein
MSRLAQEKGNNVFEKFFGCGFLKIQSGKARMPENS